MDQDLETLQVTFAEGMLVRETLETDPGATRMLGRGMFQGKLEELGYTKAELNKLVTRGILKKTTTMFQNSWRTTYVLLGSK